MGPMILKEMKYNLHYGDVRGDVLPPSFSPELRNYFETYLNTILGQCKEMTKILITLILLSKSHGLCNCKKSRWLLGDFCFLTKVYIFS